MILETVSTNKIPDITITSSSHLGFVVVTANTEHAKKWLGEKTYTYEVSEWKRVEKEARKIGYSIKRSA